MIKYRIKIFKDDKGITRYLPQYRKYFIWWSGEVLYAIYSQAIEELEKHKRNLPFKSFYIYYKNNEL